MQLKRKTPMPMPVRPKLPVGGIQLAPRGPISKTLAVTICPQPCCDSKDQQQLHQHEHGHHHHPTVITKKQRPSPPLSSTKVPPTQPSIGGGCDDTNNFHPLTLTPLPITSKVTTTTKSLLDHQLQPLQNPLLLPQGQQQQQQQEQPSQWDLFKLEDIISDEMFIPSTEPMVFDESIMSLGTEASEVGPGTETSALPAKDTSAVAVVTTNSTPTLAPAPTPMPMPPQPQLVPSVTHNISTTTNKSSIRNHKYTSTSSTSQSVTTLNGRTTSAPAPAAIAGPASAPAAGGGAVDPHVLHRTILLFPNDANLVQTALLGGPPQAILTPTNPASGGPTSSGGFTYPLHMALCQGANLPVLQLLVQAGGPNALIQRDGHQGYTPLMLALTILPNRPDVHQLLFRAYPQAARIMCTSGQDEFPLHVACRNSGQRNCIDLIHGLLADHPQAVLQPSKRDGLTPLQIIAVQDPSTSPHKTILYQALQQVAVTAQAQAQAQNSFLNPAAAQLQQQRRGGGGAARGIGGILAAPCS